MRITRSLLEELLAAGYDPMEFLPGSFPPLSPLSSNTSESSVTESTPHSTRAKPSSDSEVENILQVLETGNLTQGPVTRSRAHAIQLQEQLNQPVTPSSSTPNQTNANLHSAPQAPNPISSIPQSAPQAPSSINQPVQSAQHIPTALATHVISTTHPAPPRRRRMVVADLWPGTSAPLRASMKNIWKR